MNIKEITQAYFKNKVSLKEYHQLLKSIEEKRHRTEISKKQNSRSMSSTKWN